MYQNMKIYIRESKIVHMLLMSIPEDLNFNVEDKIQQQSMYNQSSNYYVNHTVLFFITHHVFFVVVTHSKLLKIISTAAYFLLQDIIKKPMKIESYLFTNYT